MPSATGASRPARGSDKAHGKKKKQRRIVPPVYHAHNDDHGQDQQVQTDGRETRQWQQLAPRRLGLCGFVLFGIVGHNVCR